MHRREFALLGAAALSVLGAAPRADADVVLDDSRDTVRMKIENDTVGHVLDALSQKGSLRYRSPAPLNKAIGGTFSGSLGEVLSCILDRFDFVVIYKPQGVELLVYGESRAKPILPSELGAAQQFQRNSHVAANATARMNLAPKHLTPRGPSRFDFATSPLFGSR